MKTWSITTTPAGEVRIERAGAAPWYLTPNKARALRDDLDRAHEVALDAPAARRVDVLLRLTPDQVAVMLDRSERHALSRVARGRTPGRRAGAFLTDAGLATRDRRITERGRAVAAALAER